GGRGEDPLRPVPVIATTRIRVRYKDTDCMKVEFLRQQGLAMSQVDRQIHLPVVEGLVRYREPARLDDLLQVRCWVSERRRAAFRAYEVLDEGGEPGAPGSPPPACLDPSTQREGAVPALV